MSTGDGRKPRPLVERRKAFAERMASTATGPFAARKPEGHGPPNRHGMPQVPVGQRVVENWPVLDLGDTPDISLEAWRLEVDGLCDAPRVYNWHDFLALPQVEDVSDFHCVTGWSRLDNRWTGVRFLDIAEDVRVSPEARHVLVTAHDRAPGLGVPYTTNVPLSEALSEDVLLVHRWEGAPLPREHGGPVRMITPRLYAWKGAKWIKRVTFLDEEQRGFWERNGYSNTAYPWYDDRYRYD